MKRIFTSVATIAIVIVNVNLVSGQNDWATGYIIKNQGDTLYGYIDNRDSHSNSQQCYFRSSKQSEKQVFSPADISGYRYDNGRFFISKCTENTKSCEPVFLEFLVHGSVDMYHYKDVADHYYIEKEGKIYELKNTKEIKKYNDVTYQKENKEYVGVLTALLKDADIQPQIQKTTFGTKSLIKIAKTYHEKTCTDEACIIYEKTKKTIHVIWGIQAGISWNKFRFGKETESDVGSAILIGGKFEFENIIDWQENLSFEIDATLQQYTKYHLTEIEKSYYDLISYNNTEYTLTNNQYLNGLYDGISDLEVNIKTTILKIPFVLKYNFLKGKIRPYAGVGYINAIVLGQNQDFIYKRFYYKFNKSIPTYQGGLLGRAGTNFSFHNGQSACLELNFERTMSMNINQHSRFNNSIFSLSVGYMF
jgi:hypothetical protein